jgi:hypothetical protein
VIFITVDPLVASGTDSSCSRQTKCFHGKAIFYSRESGNKRALSREFLESREQFLLDKTYNMESLSNENNNIV